MPRRKKPTDVPYPKKFRQKLEKMAAAREERATFARLDELADRATAVLAREFLIPGSVHLLHGVGDDVRMRLNLNYQIDPPLQAAWVYATPPWETEIPPA